MTQLPTGHGLLVAEKSSARDEIEKTYNKHKSQLPYTLDFQQFHGHVTQLKMPGEIKPAWKKWDLKNLPMIPTNWEYRPEKNRKRYDDVLNTIKNGNYDFIVNGGDFEREGQLIQDAFFSTMPAPLKQIPMYRLWSNDMTDPSLFKGLQNLLLPDDHIPNAGTVKNLSEASFIRARFDWLLGLNTTQLLSLKTNTHINVGRVKLPILNIIVQREKEVRNFVVKPFWTLKMTFTTPNGEKYDGFLVDEDGKPKQFFDQDEAKKLAQTVSEQHNASVSKVDIQKVQEKAPKFYATAAIQGDAADNYGIPATPTLDTLEKLYQDKITTYPRTDSHSITTDMAKTIDEVIEVSKQIPVLAPYATPDATRITAFQKNKSYVNNKDARAHTALMPVNKATFKYSSLSDQEQKILYLIARSTLLPMMDPISKEKTTIITNVGDFKFKTNGSRILDKGWSQAVPEYTSKDQLVPQMNEGDQVQIDGQDLKEGKTTPPKRYNLRTLLTLLENVSRLLTTDEEKLAMKKAEGLGRPSTRSAILDSLAENKMINVKGKKQEYSATDFGISIIENLQSNAMVSPELTARWESKLQDVEDGKLDAAILYQQMVKYTEQVISQLNQLDLQIEHVPDFGDGPLGTLSNGNEVVEAGSGYYDSEFKAYMDERQKAKDAGETMPEFHGFWLSKSIDTPKMKMKGTFTRKDLQKLLNGETITKHMIWKQSKRESDTKMKLDEDNRVKFIFDKSNNNTDEVSIPGHQVSLITGSKNGKDYAFYVISDLTPELHVAKNILGAEITPEDIKTLLDTGKIAPKTFTNKGKTFKTGLKLENGKVSFDFNNDLKQLGTIDGTKVEYGEGESKGRKFAYYQLSGKVNGRVYSPMSQVEITQADIETLIKTGKIFKTDWVSRKGSKFSADVVIKNGKAVFDF